MRALNMVCGIAVLILSLHMVHAIHHFISHPPDEAHGAVFFCVLVAGIAIGVLSFIGGILLVKRNN
jgi:hypothetical protein